MRQFNQIRTYDREASVVFKKTKDVFGGLSNMAAGFPIDIYGRRYWTSEVLYQACRFPHMPKVQELVVNQRSPMTAKMKSRSYHDDSRGDWTQVRIATMKWCLGAKLVRNWSGFSELLLESGNRPIVEESRKDTFWGAKSRDNGTLEGVNALGRLLMELREKLKCDPESLLRVEPVKIDDFLLFSKPIPVLESECDFLPTVISEKASHANLDLFSSSSATMFAHATSSKFDILQRTK